MQKSKWVSFCGWAVVAGVLLHVGAIAIDYRYRPGPYPVPQSVMALVLVAMFPCFGLWVIGSLLHRGRVLAAKVNAEAMMTAANKVGLTGLPNLAPLARRPATPAAVTICGVCNREPATVRCIVHGVLLCPACWAVHESTTHGLGAGAPAAAKG